MLADLKRSLMLSFVDGWSLWSLGAGGVSVETSMAMSGGSGSSDPSEEVVIVAKEEGCFVESYVKFLPLKKHVNLLQMNVPNYRIL